jgi:competence protein ComEC
VLLLTLNGMLLLHPAWARSLGFQLSAAATAGLILTAPGLEQALVRRLPRRCR